MPLTKEQSKKQWVKWATNYGIDKLYDAIIRSVQDAQGTCKHCHEPIFCDIVEGGGVPDWKTQNGDYGCIASPDTCSEGTGSHEPIKL